MSSVAVAAADTVAVMEEGNTEISEASDSVNSRTWRVVGDEDLMTMTLALAEAEI